MCGIPPVRDNAFVIGVLGGSVAYRFCQSHALEETLNMGGLPHDRTAQVIPLAFEGYRHPQQLNALLLALMQGTRLDLVISLDSLNEVTMGIDNLRNGASLLLPDRSMMARLRELHQPDLRWDTLRALYMIRKCSRSELGVLKTVDGAPWRFSVAANLVGDLQSQACKRRAQVIEATWAADVARPARTQTPTGADTLEPDKTARDIARYWASSITFTDAVCERRDIPYIAFIQPSLFIPEKPLSANEEKVRPVNDAVIESALQGVREAASACEQKGIVVCDLTDVFRDTRDTVYTDFCHLNARGESIVTERIAATIRAQLLGGAQASHPSPSD